jgi:hypothetical protein
MIFIMRKGPINFLYQYRDYHFPIAYEESDEIAGRLSGIPTSNMVLSSARFSCVNNKLKSGISISIDVLNVHFQH